VNWFEERLYPDVQQRHKILKVLHELKTDFQKLVIFESAVFGRVLALDDVVQTTERDEFVYHEMLTHVPILAHGQARKVLIIGGGDGGILREVLQHKTIEKATMVEIDPGVVELSKKYLPTICGKAFEDRRTDLVIGDGARFVAETKERYDVVIVDSTDPAGPGEVLFGEPFYGNCRRALTERGILVTQNGVPFMQGEELTNSFRRMRPHFADVSCYLAHVPTYAFGAMALGWASADPENRRQSRETIAKRYQSSGIRTRYYNGNLHMGCFDLPTYVQVLLK
jgi:spermidine synthase